MLKPYLVIMPTLCLILFSTYDAKNCASINYLTQALMTGNWVACC